MVKAETREADKQSRPAKRWRIAHKLTIASVLMILLTLLAGGVGLWQVFAIGQAVSDVHEKEQQRAWSLELLSAGHSLVAALDHMLLTQDSTLMSTNVPVSLGYLIFYMETMQESGGDPETADALGEMQATYDELRRAVSEVDVLARQEHWTEVNTALDQEVRPASKYMNLLLRRLARQTSYDVRAATLRARTVVQRATLLLAVLVALTTIIALGWRQFVFRGMGRSIAELRQGVERISSGDLAYKLAVRTGDEIEELGDEFNKMADELAGLIGGLEQQVAERTRDLERRAVQLEAAAEVARDATAIRDVDKLLDETAHLISDRFGFYHAGVFLVDDKREYAVLHAASSEGGQRMLARGHKLAVGKVGMVGYVTGTGEPRIALDVGEDAVHFVNPDLPETRSEMTLPLRVRGEVIGALDVQSTKEAAFSDEDIAVLQTMADQLAVAIENARLFEQTQASLRELDTLYRLHTREEWEQLPQERAVVTGYRYSPAGVSPAGETWWPEIGEAVRRGETTIQSDDGGELLTTPIALRGQPIGALSFRRPAEVGAWSAQDVALMEATADQVASALENVRLMRESRQWAQREFTIREIADKVSASFDLDTILRTTVEELGTVLGASGALVELGPPQKEMGEATPAPPSLAGKGAGGLGQSTLEMPEEEA